MLKNFENDKKQDEESTITKEEWEASINMKKTEILEGDRWFKLLTYNVFMRPPPIKTNDDDYKNERMKLLCEYLENYDCVNFQELFPELNSRREYIIQEAKYKGICHHNIPPSPSLLSFKLLNCGLLTSCKYPIVSKQFHAFSSSSGIDGVAQKGVLYSKIGLAGTKYIHLFNVHTQATYSNDYDKTQLSYVQARFNQLIEMRRTISKVMSNDNKFSSTSPESFDDIILLVGDFNVNGRPAKMPPYMSLNDSRAQKFVKDNKDNLLEYDLMKYILTDYGKDSIVDFLRERDYEGLSPITFGDSLVGENGELIPTETVLTGKHEQLWMQALDYVFQLLPFMNEVSRVKAVAEVQKFEVLGQPFTQLSDHYAVEILLEY